MKQEKFSIIVIIYILLTSSLMAQNPSILVVDPSNNWDDTGIAGNTPITVNQGDKVWFVARGIYITDPDYPLFEWIIGGPGGRSIPSPSYPFQEFPADALIGKIGDGDPFLVGQGTWIEARNSGNLFFRVNDSVLGDNQGYFVVFIYIGHIPSVSVSSSQVIPKSVKLKQNFPNPFNPSTNIKYTIDKRGFVTIVVYDILGKEITNLVERYQEPGEYIINWDGRNRQGKPVSSGTYFYRLQIGDYKSSKKMIMVR